MNINFDVENLRVIGNNYKTYVIVTDYVRRVDVFKGPLNEGCFDMIQFYFDSGWLNDCTWTKKEVPLKGGWSQLITEAVDKNGDEVFNITVNIKDKLITPVQETKKISGGQAFLLGAIAGFFPLSTVLEFLGVGCAIKYLSENKTKE